ncbi:MAG TPA: hypothetical protein VFF34_01760, partial [Candidatus Nitrosocosmicus sp.]|nr:hypothetical protein [Candidatus Nitrosocosmicus sp.]
RHDFDLSGVFAVADVEALTEKLTPNPAEQGTVRVQGNVEMAGPGLQFSGEVLDIGSGSRSSSGRIRPRAATSDARCTSSTTT